MRSEEDTALWSKTLFMTKAGIIVPTITGTISAISSILIIFIIFRSASKFSTTYHRIMFFLSFWDIIVSIAIALTTIPMNSDVKDIYPFEGPTLGTIETCQAQAYIILMGMNFTATTQTCLAWYYVCTICFNMSVDRIRRKVEPVFLFLSTFVSISLPTIFLRLGSLNAIPVYSGCYVGPYPFDCYDVEVECIRGGDLASNPSQILKVTVPVALFLLFSIIIAMVLIIRKVVLLEFQQQEHRRQWVQSRRREIEHTGSSFRSDFAAQILQGRVYPTKVVTVQALMYIVSFVLVWAFELRLVMRQQPNPTVAMLNQIFQPLQGFFNAMIFLYHKIFILKKSRPRDCVTVLDAIRILLEKKEADDLYLFSNMTLVNNHDFKRAVEGNRRGRINQLRLMSDKESPDNAVCSKNSSGSEDNESVQEVSVLGRVNSCDVEISDRSAESQSQMTNNVESHASHSRFSLDQGTFYTPIRKHYSFGISVNDDPDYSPNRGMPSFISNSDGTRGDKTRRNSTVCSIHKVDINENEKSIGGPIEIRSAQSDEYC